MKKLLIAAILLCAMLGISGCAVNQAGTRTIQYGVDGLTVASETVEAPTNALVEIEKEKSVQTCWKEYGKTNKVLLDSVKENPTMVLLIKQTDSLNNAMSLLKTGKSYNPCPTSPNSIDADIAESVMYTSIYHDGIDALKFLGGIWGGVEISDNLMSALSRAGGYALSATGAGSSISVSDSFKEAVFGAPAGGSSISNMFNRPTDNSVVSLLPAEGQ